MLNILFYHCFMYLGGILEHWWMRTLRSLKPETQTQIRGQKKRHKNKILGCWTGKGNMRRPLKRSPESILDFDECDMAGKRRVQINPNSSSHFRITDSHPSLNEIVGWSKLCRCSRITRGNSRDCITTGSSATGGAKQSKATKLIQVDNGGSRWARKDGSGNQSMSTDTAVVSAILIELLHKESICSHHCRIHVVAQSHFDGLRASQDSEGSFELVGLAVDIPDCR